MEPFERAERRRSVSIPSLIAWLSLCILAAAWGRTLDQRWQSIWAIAGSFGLVAAVGLGSLEKARHALHRRARERAMRLRAEFGLARLNEEGAARDAIVVALRRLHERADAGTNGKQDVGESWQPDEQNPVFGALPLQITPVVDLDGENYARGDALPGLLREVSAHGVSFTHSMPFIGRVAMLTFDLGGNQQISFVIDVMWSESTPEGFVTGGTILDAGVPCDHESSDELAVPAELCTV